MVYVLQIFSHQVTHFFANSPLNDHFTLSSYVRPTIPRELSLTAFSYLETSVSLLRLFSFHFLDGNSSLFNTSCKQFDPSRSNSAFSFFHPWTYLAYNFFFASHNLPPKCASSLKPLPIFASFRKMLPHISPLMHTVKLTP